MSILVGGVARRSQRFSQHPASRITAQAATPRRSPSSTTISTYVEKRVDHNISRELLRAGRVSGRPLSRLPTTDVFRNILLGGFFSSPILFKPGFAFLRAIAKSRSRLLNPDKNPILRAILKPLLYDHFCAGKTHSDIQRTREHVKSIGYSGVVLCYAKEIQIPRSNELQSMESTASREIQHWKDGNLETLEMIGSEDWLAIKLTGAGSEVVKALMNGEKPPEEFDRAIDLICEKAAIQGCRILIDAEQQVVQKSIDRLTITLMRRYNRDGRTLVYNTIQAYLKASRKKLTEQLALSHHEGWTLGLKLVRGAYIDNDQRELIYDDKSSTDNSYNGIVQDVLAGENLGLEGGEIPQNFKLMLATHNPYSISMAQSLVRSLSAQGQLKVVPDFAQLQGMGDVTGCEFLDQCEATDAKGNIVSSNAIKPAMYKYLTWGSIQECMHYLFRRAVENSGGTDRIREDLRANWSELKQRIFGSN